MLNKTYIFLLILFTWTLLSFSSSLKQKHPEFKNLKILVYTASLGFSHIQYQAKIADSLAEAGHEVHFLKFESSPQWAHYNGTEKSQKVIVIRPKNPMKEMDLNAIDVVKKPFDGHYDRFVDPKLWEIFDKMKNAICQEFLSQTELLTQLSAEQYDVAISELYDTCAFGIFHHIGARVKLSSLACTLNQIWAVQFGIPSFSSYVSNVLNPSLSAPNMNFLERAANLYNDIYQARIHNNLLDTQQALFQAEFGSSFASLRSIMRNVSLVFVNSNEFFELPRPLSNKVIYIGRIVKSKVEEAMSKKVAEIIQKSKDGVVLFSFRSVIDTTKMSQTMTESFLNVFAKFPNYNFIWKFVRNENDTSEVFAKTPNVFTMKWVNQNAILNHPKTLAFITHCGQNSANEAIQAGVPVVGIPLFGDQWYNAAVLRNKKVAEILDIRQLTSDPQKLFNALNEVLHNPGYRNSAKILKMKLDLHPFSASEKLVKWVEFAAEFENLNELNLPNSEELGFFVYHSLDVVFAAMAVILIAIMATFVTVKWILKRFFLEIQKLRKLKIS